MSLITPQINEINKFKTTSIAKELITYYFIKNFIEKQVGNEWLDFDQIKNEIEKLRLYKTYKNDLLKIWKQTEKEHYKKLNEVENAMNYDLNYDFEYDYDDHMAYEEKKQEKRRKLMKVYGCDYDDDFINMEELEIEFYLDRRAYRHSRFN